VKLALTLIFLAGLNSTVGNLLLKYSRLSTENTEAWFERFFSPYFFGANLFFVVNLVLFAKALDRIPVSIGYPILAASSFAMLTVASRYFFDEAFGPWQVVGLLFEMTGTFCLSKTA